MILAVTNDSTISPRLSLTGASRLHQTVFQSTEGGRLRWDALPRSDSQVAKTVNRSIDV